LELSPHTRRLLQDPIVPMLLRMAWPNILIMVAQAATGLIETWWIARWERRPGRHGVVFPPVMLMQMISAGAMGGGSPRRSPVRSAACCRDEADALVLHAVVINIVLGLAFSAVMLAFGRPIYTRSVVLAANWKRPSSTRMWFSPAMCCSGS